MSLAGIKLKNSTNKILDVFQKKTPIVSVVLPWINVIVTSLHCCTCIYYVLCRL